MSYYVSLQDPVDGSTLHTDAPHQMQGATYQVGGTTEMALSVTYNYGIPFKQAFGLQGLTTIHKMSGSESIAVLKAAIGKLGNDVSPDYWAATEGNAKKALCQLLALAQLRPDGVWLVD